MLTVARLAPEATEDNMVSSLWAWDGQMRDDGAEAITALTSVTALSRESLSVRAAVQQLYTWWMTSFYAVQLFRS